MDTDRIILTSAMVTVGSTVGTSILPEHYGGQGELPSFRLLIGSALTFTGLSMLGEFAPEPAAGLAAAIAITALTYYGIPLLEKYATGESTVGVMDRFAVTPLPSDLEDPTLADRRVR